MISRARAEASRSNGRKSRGPRTAAGRSCASHNALRHGLAALTYKPAAFAEVERIAKAICNGNTDPLLFEQALVIAENEMVRRCVRVEAIALIERLRDITVNPLAAVRQDRRAREQCRPVCAAAGDKVHRDRCAALGPGDGGQSARPVPDGQACSAANAARA